MTIALLLFAQAQSADSVLNRFSMAAKNMASFEVNALVAEGGYEAKADFIIDRDRRLFYQADTLQGGERYTLSISPSGYRETERLNHLYDESPYPGQLAVYKSRISPLSETVPIWLKTKDLHQLFPSSAAKTMEGTETIDGNLCDKVKVSFESKMGKGTQYFSIARSGLIYYYRNISVTQMKKVDIAWTFSHYRQLNAISAARFQNKIPDGYMPYALPDRDNPIEIGHKPTLRGWVDSSSGKPWVPIAGRPLLFLLAGTNSLPSRRAVALAKKWNHTLNGKGVELAIASDSISKERAEGLLFDPDRISINSFAISTTPMFFLIDKTGAVRNLWLGYIPGQEDKFSRDVLDAVVALK